MAQPNRFPLAQSYRFSSLNRPIVGVILGNRLPLTKGVKELAKANKWAKTTLVFFSTEGINFGNRTISGVSFNDAKGRWENKQVPFPDVLYVRGGSGNRVTDAIRRFDNMGIRRINPIVGFNKGELFDKLKKVPGMRAYLPRTDHLEKIDELKSKIQKLKDVYLKASLGRRGKMVMRVTKLSGGGYEYRYSIIDKLVRKKVKTFKELKAKVQSFFGEREVIVQQAIDLLRVGKNRLVDFRAELQRNKNGNIEIVAVPVRIGRSNSPITTHSSSYRSEAYLKKLFPHYSTRKLNTLKNRMNSFLITLYRSVEKIYGKFGEIGIDFAVDKKGNIWLIECNAQSAKVSIRKSYGAKTVRRVYLNPLEYAKTITRSSLGNRSQTPRGFAGYPYFNNR